MTRRLVDLFCGCGGISLGFMAAGGWRKIKPVLAIDTDPASVRAYNKNLGPLVGSPSIAVECDISEFIHPAEVRAFYLERLAEVESDTQISKQLSSMGFDELKTGLHDLDSRHFDSLRAFIAASELKNAYSKLEERLKRSSLLIRFLARFRLPPLGVTPSRLPRCLWGQYPLGRAASKISRSIQRNPLAQSLERNLRDRWERDVARIAKVSTRFGSFLKGGLGFSLQKMQIGWLVDRFQLRSEFWLGKRVQSMVASIYSTRRADLVVGGPPCQGFSRPGRAKLGSLGEKGELAFVDEDFGDERNRLYQHYLLFLSALDPDVFLFENVNTFKSTVATENKGSISVEKALEQDIRGMGGSGQGFRIASRILDAANHKIPQRRLRYFMIGCSERFPSSRSVRAALDGVGSTVGRVRSHVAFCGLGKIRWDGMAVETEVSAPDPFDGLPPLESDFAGWLRLDSKGQLVRRTDAHVARRPTPDDSKFFRRLGPGVRWKDFKGVEKVLRAINPEHHFLRPKYLRKGDSNHGDWLARLDGKTISRTICAHLSKDGYAYIHPTEARTISVREAARLQSFPDWFSFSEIPMGQAFRMIGNAVPPLMSRLLAEDVVLSLLGVSAREKGVGATLISRELNAGRAPKKGRRG